MLFQWNSIWEVASLTDGLYFRQKARLIYCTVYLHLFGETSILLRGNLTTFCRALRAYHGQTRRYSNPQPTDEESNMLTSVLNVLWKVSRLNTINLGYSSSIIFNRMLWHEVGDKISRGWRCVKNGKNATNKTFRNTFYKFLIKLVTRSTVCNRRLYWFGTQWATFSFKLCRWSFLGKAL